MTVGRGAAATKHARGAALASDLRGAAARNLTRGTALATDVRGAGARNLTRGTALATDVELARSFWARFMGLMGRATLPADHGLWISGSNGIHMFFVRFAIDAVFLGKAAGDGSRPVVAVRRSLAPWTGLVPFVRRGDSVLELPVGTIDGSGTQVGDRVEVQVT